MLKGYKEEGDPVNTEEKEGQRSIRKREGKNPKTMQNQKEGREQS